MSEATPTPTPYDAKAERSRAQRNALQSKHAQGLTRLMGQRDDLRGVHALADLVDDAVRWSA